MTADILKEIVAQKWRELKQRQDLVGLDDLKRQAESMPPTRGFKDSLLATVQAGKPAVIAEIKKASPSKGIIRADFDPVAIARSYERGGASCLSVLTDETFFKGCDEYLTMARLNVSLPVLRKDFTVDPYQVFEARVLGADCILLIVSILDDAQLLSLHLLAKSLGLNVLVEVHNATELDRAMKISPDILGINNRNLRTFEVSLEVTLELKRKVTTDCLLVTESGIHTRHDVERMRGAGIHSFLVGEAFMRDEHPGKKLEALFF